MAFWGKWAVDGAIEIMVFRNSRTSCMRDGGKIGAEGAYRVNICFGHGGRTCIIDPH